MSNYEVIGRETKRLDGEPDHRFEIVRFSNGRVFVASINERIEDWAVYTGPGPDWLMVRSHGDKLPALEAAAMFPDEAAKYRYRS